MPGIGRYDVPVLILTRQLAAADGFGQEAESWPDPAAGTGEEWAAEEQPGGSEQVALGLRQHVSSVRLRVRGRATVAPVDRVRRLDTGETLRILGLWREGWDTVLICEGV